MVFPQHFSLLVCSPHSHTLCYLASPPFTAVLTETAALPGKLPFEEKQCYSLCTHHVDANKLQGCEVSRLLIQIAPSPTRPSTSSVYSWCCTEEPH